MTGILLEKILDWQPDIICCTLYLWNIERTLHLLRRVRQDLARVKVIVGGPEVAFQHPFLFRTGIPDVAVVGEGEMVFPQILSALEKGLQTNFRQVAWKTGRRYSWGKLPSPDVTLQECLPPAHHSSWKPDPHGMAYLETGRGCPLRCSYCRYGHLRRKTTFLDARGGEPARSHSHGSGSQRNPVRGPCVQCQSGVPRNSQRPFAN